MPTLQPHFPQLPDSPLAERPTAKGWRRLTHWLTGQRHNLCQRSQSPTEPLATLQWLLSDLACDVATATDLQQLSALLAPLQSWLQQQLPQQQPAPLQALILPIGSQTDSQLQYVSLSQSFKPPVAEARRLINSPAHWLENTACLVSLPLANGRGWLLLSTGLAAQQDNPGAINTAIHEICRRLQKGLNGWFLQQQRVSSALQDERKWQAAELHDSVAQLLGYVRMQSGRLANRCETLDDLAQLPALAQAARDVEHHSLFAYRQTRELIATARLSSQADSLASGLEQLVDEYEQRSSLVFELDNRCSAASLANCKFTDQQTTQLLYIVRESICNLVRHAHASHARIRLQWQTSEQGRLLSCSIEDNGRGIRQPERSGSFGLQIMQERAQRIGASLTIESRKPSGTRIALSIPVQ
ncbi:sensor histidine kinase [Oceanobacter mangrovi]|uniref:sensor histidine kinase n=1 Tax=Oceanobacter mangrovi TaxID=2862510 RepID=UPI001C8DBC12|nr:ATP-binding protein [Oceanobacter mangrovi]